MKVEDLYINHSRITLGERIGRGGEGEVYRILEQPHLVAKLYHEDIAPLREDKILHMIAHDLGKDASMIAFPCQAIHNAAGRFLGFSMSGVSHHHAIHELYGVKSRKQHFPEVDYRFLTRVARNICIAMAQVHSKNCIIGDINHSGFLVSKNATVTLIDADSFQVTHPENRFPCMVGVPDYTPPELQNLSFTSVTRTTEHDLFGLGVMIFHLLFLGRHPYAGEHVKQDLSLPEMITGHHFAYSLSRNLEVQSPKHTLRLSDLPKQVQNLFESCFGTSPQDRPSCASWIEALTSMEQTLQPCASHSNHYYSPAASSCPFCRIESKSSVVLFHEKTSHRFQAGDEASLAQLWEALDHYQVDVSPYLLKSLKNQVIGAVSKTVRVAPPKSVQIILYSLVALIIAFTLYVPDIFFLSAIPIFGIPLILRLCSHNDSQKFVAVHAKAEASFVELLRSRMETEGGDSIRNTLQELELLKSTFRFIQHNRNADNSIELKDVLKEDLDHFLSKFILGPGLVRGIGQIRVDRLKEKGIFNASHIHKSALEDISYLDQTQVDQLLHWRDECKNAFLPSPLLPKRLHQKKLKIEETYKKQITATFHQGVALWTQLQEATHQLYRHFSKADAELREAYLRMQQAEYDLKHLKIVFISQSWTSACVLRVPRSRAEKA